MNRVWQSPSVDHWLPLPTSLGVESNAFAAVVKSLEISVGKLLVPQTRVRDTSLPRIYCRTMQNAGVLGRARHEIILFVVATGGKNYIEPPVRIYRHYKAIYPWSTIGGIYCQLGDYIILLPTTLLPKARKLHSGD